MCNSWTTILDRVRGIQWEPNGWVGEVRWAYVPRGEGADRRCVANGECQLSRGGAFLGSVVGVGLGGDLSIVVGPGAEAWCAIDYVVVVASVQWEPNGRGVQWEPNGRGGE